MGSGGKFRLYVALRPTSYVALRLMLRYALGVTLRYALTLRYVHTP